MAKASKGLKVCFYQDPRQKFFSTITLGSQLVIKGNFKNQVND
jgi:hypothetical protein